MHQPGTILPFKLAWHGVVLGLLCHDTSVRFLGHPTGFKGLTCLWCVSHLQRYHDQYWSMAMQSSLWIIHFP